MPQMIIQKVVQVRIDSNIVQLPGSREFMRQIDLECEDGSVINMALFAPYADCLVLNGETKEPGIQEPLSE